jgi:hypothetical protein
MATTAVETIIFANLQNKQQLTFDALNKKLSV